MPLREARPRTGTADDPSPAEAAVLTAGAGVRLLWATVIVAGLWALVAWALA